ncbi:hypothetical protein GF351_01540 [Candidatus Woesearchaeota archaeon]|nr:hypothetical protein [Candidatus Woesearchaeota archaeon]
MEQQRDQETGLPNLEYLTEYMQRMHIPSGTSAALALIEVQDIQTPRIPTIVNISRKLLDYRKEKGNKCTKVARVDGRDCFALVYSGIKEAQELNKKFEDLEQSVEGMRFDGSGNCVPEGAYSVGVKAVADLYDRNSHQLAHAYIESVVNRLDQA